MTYCCGVLVRDGLVMIADTRTNAGLDNVSTFRKLHVFKQPGERIMAIASSGNLSISQSVVSTLTEGIENKEILARLMQYGDIKGQGFLYGQPQPASVTRERLASLDLLNETEEKTQIVRYSSDTPTPKAAGEF